MAYTSCASVIAASIAKDCNNPIVGGYTGRGVLFALNVAPTITTSGTNPRIITAIAKGTGGVTAAVDNVWASPFDGSNTQSNGDQGRIGYTKTFTFRVPLRGADASKDVIEPLVDAPLGYLAILEKKDRSGKGSFEVVGYRQALTVNADGVTRNEAENGGDVVVTMSCTEPWFEVEFFDTDYTTTLAAFEALLAGSL